MISVGIDPGSKYLGLGIISLTDKHLECLSLERVRVAGKSLGTIVLHVQSRIMPYLDSPIMLSYEKPPKAARRDANHGFQAPIGFRLGLISGAIISPYLNNPGVRIEEVEVTQWRNNVLDFCRVAGPPVSRPNRRNLAQHTTKSGDPCLLPNLTSVKKGWIGQYSCGCKVELPTFKSVQQASKVCPNCSGKRPEFNVATAVRDEWKALACRVIKEHFRNSYDDLVSSARKASRTEKPDYLLSGVDDACEGGCIALASLVALSGGLQLAG